ncbi:MAG: hypothetical protein A4E56_02248 [Pelotomaculum sp. PtaU1.Bin065]|nr:MAG: hypothetical protein A4E56_02248 [Pelotomaculum sp. PtaU1.Bin065]
MVINIILPWLLVILVFLVLLLSMLLKKSRSEIHACKRISEMAWEVNREIDSQLTKERQKTSYLVLSVQNITNAVNYNCSADFEKYTYLCELPEGQHIAIIFEIEREHSQNARNADCTIFVDGEKKDPILLKKLFRNRDSIEIEDFNCMDYKGRGIGTFVVQKLAEMLKSYDIKKITAKMSPVDYEKKDRLYNFYINKNGFRLVRELTKDKWGFVVKDLL